MISGIKDMIMRCMERMRGGACATCENRAFCPAGRWQQAFRPPPRNARETSGFLALLGHLVQAGTAPDTGKRCLRKAIEDALEPMLAAGEVSIDHVARSLGISRQTLYRRLKSEGTTFEQVLDAKRRQLAIRYLGLDGMPVKSAAYRLGFSDPSAFSRAFKRWTGSSPSEFKQAAAA